MLKKELNMNRKNYDLVDVSKLLLAIFVVSIHAGVPVAGWLGRLAVPYFFIISISVSESMMQWAATN